MDAQGLREIAAALMQITDDAARLPVVLGQVDQLTTTVAAERSASAALQAEVTKLRAQLDALSGPPPMPVLERPDGPGYTRYEAIYRPGMGLRQVLAAVPFGTVLTLPEGAFEFEDFNDPRGWFEGIRFPSQCKGLWGSGRDTILRMKPNTSTKANDPVAVPTKDWSPIPVALLGIWTSGAVLKNLQVQGTDQGHAYNGVRVSGTSAKPVTDVTIESVFFNGCSVGYAGFPPGETSSFGTNRADRVRLVNCEMDGRHPVTRESVGASPVAWNNGTGAYVENVHAHHHRYSTVTFWQTRDIHTKRLRSEYNSGAGINHENVGGRVLHESPTIIIDRAHAERPAMHVALLNGSYPDNPDVTLTDVTHDAGLNGGTFSVNMADGYKDPITGAPMSQRTLPKITKGGVQLVGRDTRQSGWNVGLDPAKHFVRYH